MFTLTSEAVQYVKKHGSHILITMKFEPSCGCPCRGDLIWGSYIPEIALGKAMDKSQYLQETIDGITVWYPSKLIIKQGFDSIRIYIKSVLISKWLEMDGAQGVSVTPATGFSGNTENIHKDIS